MPSLTPRPRLTFISSEEIRLRLEAEAQAEKIGRSALIARIVSDYYKTK